MTKRTLGASRVLIACMIAVSVLTACGGEKPAGPDVRGMTLPDAKIALKKAGVSATTHATDALLGVLIPENFVVCDQKAVSAHLVRLEVAKHGC